MNESPKNPAANALKHGFAAASIVAPETRELAESLQVELTELHQPQSPAESAVIADLALAQAQYLEVEKARQARIAEEKATAAARFERLAAYAFDRDRAAWQADPERRLPILAKTFLGASYMAGIWSRVAAELADDSGALAFGLACEAAMALGSPWQVDKAAGDGLAVMACYVRIAPEPAEAIEVWARESNARDGFAFSRNRAAKLVARATDPAEARRALATIAARQAAEWCALAEDFRDDEASARAAAHDCCVGLGTGDPILEKQLRLLNRYATTARNRADRLQRRLDALKHNRLIEAHRAEREADREARRLERESRTAERRYDEETKRMERERSAYYGVPDNPVYAATSSDSLIRGQQSLDDADDSALAGSAAPAGAADSSHFRTQESVSQEDTAALRNEAPNASMRIQAAGGALSVDTTTATGRLILATLRTMPDSPRRQAEIARRFGSEERFRAACAAMEGQSRV